MQDRYFKVLTSNPCDIYFQEIKDIGKKLEPYKISKEIIIIYDNNLKDLYLSALISSLEESGYLTNSISFKASEKNKNMKEALKIVEKALSFNPNKSTAIITMGGGITGDVGAFCASILLRGVPLFQIPTTLLAQVDSSVGGKTGVNTFFGKNTLGTFYQPKAIFIDVKTLNTLDKRHYFAGYSECLKYALVFDKEFFHFLDSNTYLLKSYDQNFLQEIIYKSCKFKAKVVEDDEFEEKEIRYLLNFGHTLGHALERYNNYKPSLLHGEAVLIGMMMILKFSNFLGFLPQENIIYLKNHLNKLNLKYQLDNIFKNININKLISFIEKDKKNKNNKLGFILSKKIGSAFFTKEITKEQLQLFLQEELKKTKKDK